MRFQSTFEIPPKLCRSDLADLMTSQRKYGARPLASNGDSSAIEKVLEACSQLPIAGGSLAVLRSYVAETARDTLQALVAGILIKEDETYVLGSVSTEGSPDPGKSSLISHAKAFATQAIQTNKQLSFSLISTTEAGSAYCGMAEPLITSQSATALVVLRREGFSAEEV